MAGLPTVDDGSTRKYNISIAMEFSVGTSARPRHVRFVERVRLAASEDFHRLGASRLEGPALRGISRFQRLERVRDVLLVRGHARDAIQERLGEMLAVQIDAWNRGWRVATSIPIAMGEQVFERSEVL